MIGSRPGTVSHLPPCSGNGPFSSPGMLIFELQACLRFSGGQTSKTQANRCRFQTARYSSPANNDRSCTVVLVSTPGPSATVALPPAGLPVLPERPFSRFFSSPSLLSPLLSPDPIVLRFFFLHPFLFSSLLFFLFLPVLLSTLFKNILLFSFHPLAPRKHTPFRLAVLAPSRNSGHRQPSSLSPCFQSPPCLVPASTLVRSLI